MAERFPTDQERSEAFAIQERTSMAERFPTDQERSEAFAFQKSWLRYKSSLEKDLHRMAVDLAEKKSMTDLRRRLPQKFRSVNSLLDDGSCENVAEAVWLVAIFRPDQAAELADLDPAWTSLRDAVHRNFPEDGVWAVQRPRVPADKWPAVISGLGGALAGLATCSLRHLEARRLLGPEEREEVEAAEAFSAERGRCLARYLALRSPDAVTAFIDAAEDAFLLAALCAATGGGWSLGHFVERPPVFDEAVRILTRHGRLCLWGPAGAGKTALAAQLAHSCSSKAVWLTCRHRPKQEVFADAHRRLAALLHKRPSGDAEQFLWEHLTEENTRDITFFIDDAGPELLEPFRRVKRLVVTSRVPLSATERLAEVRVPFCLTDGERKALFAKMCGRWAARGSGLLRNVPRNALATTAAAALLQDVETEEELRDAARKLDEAFDALHAPAEQLNQKIMKIHELTIDGLEESRRTAFDRLVIFPSGTAVTARVFALFYRSESWANRMLEDLKRRCILEESADGFVLQSLWGEVLQRRVAPERRKGIFADFCDACFESAAPLEVAWKDEFVRRHLMRMCLEADRTDLVRLLLSSPRYLIERAMDGCSAFRKELALAGADNRAALSLSADLAAAADGPTHRLRLLAFFHRGSLDNAVLDAAREAGVRPLFRAAHQGEEEVSVAIDSEGRLVGFQRPPLISPRFLVQYGPLSQGSFSLGFPNNQLRASSYVAWVPAQEDFCLFFANEAQTELRAELPSGEIVWSRSCWRFSRLRVTGNRVVLWEPGARSFYRIRLLINVGGKVDVPGSKDIREIYPMASLDAVLLSDGSVQLLDPPWKSTWEMVAVEVRSAAVSRCGRKLALLRRGELLEVNEVGDELRRIATGGRDLEKVFYVSDGFLAIEEDKKRSRENLYLHRTIGGHSEEWSEVRSSEYLRHVRAVLTTDQGFDLVLDEDRLCVLHAAKKKLETLFIAKDFTFSDMAGDPHGKHLRIQCDKPEGSFPLHRLD